MFFSIISHNSCVNVGHFRRPPLFAAEDMPILRAASSLRLRLDACDIALASRREPLLFQPHQLSLGAAAKDETSQSLLPCTAHTFVK
ncbi:MAG: hypothetical protein HYZ72_15175 [Deltaproteobacteria bacterium]|nr:hypothetical protein [Deltaproteobacteria bacterium]